MNDEASRGETSSQTVILLPALLLLLWVGVHVALLMHSGNVAAAVADAVARRAAAVGGADGGSLGRLADITASELSAELAASPVVRWNAETVAVTVVIRGPSLVPFLPDRVSRSATVPIERFMTEDQRR